VVSFGIFSRAWNTLSERLPYQSIAIVFGAGWTFANVDIGRRRQDQSAPDLFQRDIKVVKSGVGRASPCEQAAYRGDPPYPTGLNVRRGAKWLMANIYRAPRMTLTSHRTLGTARIAIVFGAIKTPLYLKIGWRRPVHFGELNVWRRRQNGRNAFCTEL
jgi:hypothetical protein